MTRFLKADLTADRFSWSVDEDAVSEAQLFDGTLALITNTTDISPAEAVARYKGLADIARGFRVLKSDIEIAPVHHRLPDRIRAHALICFLALTLYRVMRMRLKAKGHSASPKTALEILAKVQCRVALKCGIRKSTKSMGRLGTVQLPGVMRHAERAVQARMAK